MTPTWTHPGPVDTQAELAAADVLPIHPLAVPLREWVQETLWNAAYTRPRSRQRVIGMSEVGQACERRTAYALAGTERVNTPDPWRADVGTAIHEHLADIIRALDAGSGRYLVESPVIYRGIPGQCDLVDRKRKLVLDWKTTTSGSRKLRAKGGPSRQEVLQVAGYAAGMRALGEDIQTVALAVLPVDTGLDGARVFPYALTPELLAELDARIDRLAVLASPAEVKPAPTALCGWCPWYRPASADLSVACPGQTPNK